ncbi:hypothetical protein D3C73_427740 [compost metagenome]
MDRTSNIRLKLDADTQSLIKGNRELKAMDKYLDSIQKRVKGLERVQLMSQVNMIDRMTQSVNNLSRALDQVHLRYLSKPAVYKVLVKEKVETIRNCSITGSKEKSNKIGTVEIYKDHVSKPKASTSPINEPKKLWSLESYINNFGYNFKDKPPAQPAKGFGTLESLIDLNKKQSFLRSNEKERGPLSSFVKTVTDFEGDLSKGKDVAIGSAGVVKELIDQSGVATRNGTPEWVKTVINVSNRVGPIAKEFLDKTFKRLDTAASVATILNSQSEKELYSNIGAEIGKKVFAASFSLIAGGAMASFPATAPFAPSGAILAGALGDTLGEAPGRWLGELAYSADNYLGVGLKKIKDSLVTFTEDVGNQAVELGGDIKNKATDVVEGIGTGVSKLWNGAVDVGKGVYSYFYNETPTENSLASIYGPNTTKVDSFSAVSGKPVARQYPRNFEREFFGTVPNTVALSVKSFFPFKNTKFNPYSITDPNPNNTRLAPKKLSPQQIDSLVGYLKKDNPKKESATVNMPAGAIQVTINQGMKSLEELVTEVGKKFHIEFKKTLQNSKPKFLAN